MFRQYEQESRKADATLQAFMRRNPGERGPDFRRLLEAAQAAYARQVEMPLDRP